MLAPLKDRAVLERDDDDPQRDLPPVEAYPSPDTGNTRLASEIIALRLALRQSRRNQKRNATLAARKINNLSNEINRLAELNTKLQERLAEYESGQAVVRLGQQLMALHTANEELSAAAHRVWYLDKTLQAAHRECERLANERDSALSGLGKRVSRQLN